jgi:hypothetical protein
LEQYHYFGGDDLASDANLLGLIAFFQASYGAGTPSSDAFALRGSGVETPIAPDPFLARLPIRMLGHPRGGALAVVGLVERAWGYSISWPGVDRQTSVFGSTLARLCLGHPVGSACEYLKQHHAELATQLSSMLEDLRYGGQADAMELAAMWTASNDARNYAIIGDPAVRLPVAESNEEVIPRRMDRWIPPDGDIML